MTRETVLIDTPASRAMSMMVTLPPRSCCCMLRHVSKIRAAREALQHAWLAPEAGLGAAPDFGPSTEGPVWESERRGSLFSQVYASRLPAAAARIKYPQARVASFLRFAGALAL